MLSKVTIERLQSIPMPELFERYHIAWEEGRNFKRPWGGANSKCYNWKEI